MEIKDHITGYEKVAAKSIINNMIREWLKIDNSDVGIIVLHRIITDELKSYLNTKSYKGILAKEDQSTLLKSFLNSSIDTCTVSPKFPDK